MVLFGLVPNTSRTQDIDHGEKINLEFMIRAKALGFVIIEDHWVRTFSVGFELRASERFSVVMDAVHFRWMHEYETYPPPNPYIEYRQWDPRNYIAIEARYYPSLGIMPEDTRLYLTCFSKFGTRRVYCEELYTLEEGEVHALHSDFHDIGPAIGFQLGRRFGLDVNMGAAYRQEVKSEEIYHENAPYTYTYNVWDRRWIYNIRVNFFLNISGLR